MYVSVPLVLNSQKFGHFDLYFSNGSHFCFLYVALLPNWLILVSSYLAQLCIYTVTTHTEGIVQRWPIFLNL